MGLGTNHRLSLAQNPILLTGQIAILLASCNRDVARLRKRRQVAGREEVHAGDSESRAQFGRTPRAVRQLFQDVSYATSSLPFSRRCGTQSGRDCSNRAKFLRLAFHCFSSSTESHRKNARLAMRLIRWQHWLVLKLRNGLMTYIIPQLRTTPPPEPHH